MSFVFEGQEISGLILVKPDKFVDNRGFFEEIYKEDTFKKNGIDIDFVQDNVSCSKKGVLRGLHFQNPPYEQAKLVSCLSGKILDVAVDLRKNSKTFKKYFKKILSFENQNMLYIPKGFAHGFVALEDNSVVLYKTSDYYNQNAQNGIIWNDKELNIDWEIDYCPILSENDKKQSFFNDLKL